MWRKDFENVNGFDSSYEGWGFEDSELAIRLLNSGVKKKSGNYATGVLHLWHRENDRTHEKENLLKLQECMRSKKLRSNSGLAELDQQ